MINQLYLTPDKQHAPTSPRHRRHLPDNSPYAPSTPTPKKEGNSASGTGQSLGHHAPQHPSRPAGSDQSGEVQAVWESVARELGERVGKLAQKIGQHEAVLLRLTQNSLETNKEEYRRNVQPSTQQLDSLNEAVTRLKREFQQHRLGQSQAQASMFGEMLERRDVRMREEIQQALRRVGEGGSERSGVSEERMEEMERGLRKMEKNLSLNNGKVWSAIEKIEGVGSSIDGHMELVNAEVNKAINKIVTFINQKVSIPFTASIEGLTQRLDKLEQTQQSGSHFGGMVSSGVKSQRKAGRAQYRQLLAASSQEMIISERLYYIDTEGYLLDEERCYLTGRDGERVRLQERQIALLRKEMMML